MLVLHVALDSLGAEAALIEREVLPRFKTDDTVVLYLELNAALLPAKAAMCFYQPIRFYLRVPSLGGNSIQRWAELRNQLRHRYWRFGHISLVVSANSAARTPCSRHLPSWAIASDLRRQGGQTS